MMTRDVRADSNFDDHFPGQKNPHRTTHDGRQNNNFSFKSVFNLFVPPTRNYGDRTLSTKGSIKKETTSTFDPNSLEEFAHYAQHAREKKAALLSSDATHHQHDLRRGNDHRRSCVKVILFCAIGVAAVFGLLAGVVIFVLDTEDPLHAVRSYFDRWQYSASLISGSRTTESSSSTSGANELEGLHQDEQIRRRHEDGGNHNIDESSSTRDISEELALSEEAYEVIKGGTMVPATAETESFLEEGVVMEGSEFSKNVKMYTVRDRVHNAVYSKFFFTKYELLTYGIVAIPNAMMLGQALTIFQNVLVYCYLLCWIFVSSSVSMSTIY